MAPARHDIPIWTPDGPTGESSSWHVVAVARGGGEFKLIAAESIAAGTLVFCINGREVDHASRYSVQVEDAIHVDVEPAVDLVTALDRYPWRFMNHSCRPNTRVSGRDVIALRAIGRGEQLTFDYNTTEFELASPFRCRCASRTCAGIIRGFRFLTADERARLEPLLSPHLRRLLAADCRPPRVA